MLICAATGNAGKLKEIRRILEAQGQQAFEAKFGHKKFMEIFKKNYLIGEDEI